MNTRDLRYKRVSHGISGRLLCAKAGIDRSRLSDIERQYVEPSDDELERIEKALGALIQAKEKVVKVAAEVGWPLS